MPALANALSFLSGSKALDGPNLPTVRINALSAAQAQSFASGSLTLDQQNSFRQIQKQKGSLIENGSLADLAIGVELLSADRGLAFNQWHVNPVPALVALRSQQLPATDAGLDANQLIGGLQQLAWSTMLQDNHRFLSRESAISQALDPRVIDRAVELGFVEENGAKLRFHSEILQWHLAAENLKRDGLSKYLTRPEFAEGHGRVSKKWDCVALVLVSGLADENRLRVINQIAEVDPFLAAMCFQRFPELYQDSQESLITKLTQLCTQNAVAQSAFRSAIAALPNAGKTAELLVGQLSRFNNSQQLWLWLEIRALPLDLPVGFIQLVTEIERESASAVPVQLKPYGLSLAIAYLVKLSAHQDENIRRNAIWMLGEVKYLPTAILLLNDLENGNGNDQDDIVLALMKYAYADLLVRVLRWSQDHQQHRPAVIRALAERKRMVTSRLLSLADARRLTLNPQFYEIVVNTNERDIAIGLAQIAAEAVELPGPVAAAIRAEGKAADLRARIAASITHLPNRAGFEKLLAAISQVLSDPPENIITAGSSIEALLYGEPLFDDLRAQAEAVPQRSIPGDLLQKLRHDDWEQRQRALSSLADFPAGSALPPLLEAAHDEDKRVRLTAYGSLSGFEGEPAAQKAILAALADTDSSIVNAVTHMLKSMTSLDCEALLELLDSANPETVAAAIDLLGHARHRPAVAELERLLADERRTIAGGTTIGQLARQALDDIDSALMDGEHPAATAGTTAAPVGEDGLLAYSDEEKIKRTLNVLRDDDWGRTQKAAKFLRKFARHLRGTENAAVLRLLIDALNDDNWSVRWAGAEALAMLRNRAAIAALSARIDDPNWIVQVAVVRALVELGANGMTFNLTPLLQSSRKAVREAAAEALGELADRQAVAALGETLMDDPDEFVRLAALNAISQIEPDGARPHLELALSDSSVHLRWQAMQFMAPLMTEADLPILQQLLNDYDKPSWEDLSLHDLAVMTLQRIGSDQSKALLGAVTLVEKRSGA